MPDVKVTTLSLFDATMASSSMKRVYSGIRQAVCEVFDMPYSGVAVKPERLAEGCEDERPDISISVTIGDKPERRAQQQALTNQLTEKVKQVILNNATKNNWSIKVVVRLLPTTVASTYVFTK